MVEVRRTKFYAPKMDGKKVVVKENGKAELIPLLVRQAYIADPTGIDGIKGYIVTCRKRDGDKRVEKAAQKVLDGTLRLDKVPQYIAPYFSVQVLRESPPDTMLVKWAQCPAGIRPRWGISSDTRTLNLTQTPYHQEWFAIDTDGKVIAHHKDKHKLEMQHSGCEFVYGYMEPRTISGEKKLRTANEVKPDMVFVGERKFGNWAKHFVGGYSKALELVHSLLEDGETE